MKFIKSNSIRSLSLFVSLLCIFHYISILFLRLFSLYIYLSLSRMCPKHDGETNPPQTPNIHSLCNRHNMPFLPSRLNYCYRHTRSHHPLPDPRLSFDRQSAGPRAAAAVRSDGFDAVAGMLPGRRAGDAATGRGCESDAQDHQQGQVCVHVAL